MGEFLDEQGQASLGSTSVALWRHFLQECVVDPLLADWDTMWPLQGFSEDLARKLFDLELTLRPRRASHWYVSMLYLRRPTDPYVTWLWSILQMMAPGAEIDADTWFSVEYQVIMNSLSRYCSAVFVGFTVPRIFCHGGVPGACGFCATRLRGSTRLYHKIVALLPSNLRILSDRVASVILHTLQNRGCGFDPRTFYDGTSLQIQSQDLEPVVFANAIGLVVQGLLRETESLFAGEADDVHYLGHLETCAFMWCHGAEDDQLEHHENWDSAMDTFYLGMEEKEIADILEVDAWRAFIVELEGARRPYLELNLNLTCRL